jgi:acyl-ACP thioesterase
VATSEAMVPVPARGRVFEYSAIVGLGDVTPSGRARLDAIARWLQDVAYADVLDAGIADDGAWIVRRLDLRVERFPRFWEPLEIATFCSGTGRLWGERRTTIAGGGGGRIEAAALWVHLDAEGRPRPLTAEFHAIYGEAAAGRRVRARLLHPAAPPPDAATRPWTFRVADLDLARHVNNAAYWAVLEEELAGAELGERFRAEIEHRAAGGPGPAQVAADGAHRWITSDGYVLATLALPTGVAPVA